MTYSASNDVASPVTHYWPRLTRSPVATLLAAAGAMVVIALVCGTQTYVADARERQDVALLAAVSGKPCFGAPAMEHLAACPDALTAMPLVPVSKADAPWAPQPGCHGSGSDPAVLKCFWGTGVPSRVVALVGNSHAEHWENVFDPVSSGPAGFEKVWRDWLAFSRVTVVRDIPTTDDKNGPQCLAVNAGKPQACANPRSKVLVDDDMMRAARSMPREVNLVDLSDCFCDASRCYAVIGGSGVYCDCDHMSMQFSATLAAALLRGLPAS